MIMKIMPLIFIALSAARATACRLRRRKNAATIITATTPKAAASVGVAIPRMISPMTMKMMNIIGRRFTTASLSFSRPLVWGTS